jgi:hypothetical protein
MLFCLAVRMLRLSPPEKAREASWLSLRVSTWVRATVPWLVGGYLEGGGTVGEELDPVVVEVLS